jgi:hypothetical protein
VCEKGEGILFVYPIFIEKTLAPPLFTEEKIEE